jgi:hypothetical protein
MNDQPIGTNARASGATAISDDFRPVQSERRASSEGWVEAGIIVAIWVTAYVVFTIQQLMMAQPGAKWWFLVPRALSCGAGVVISFGIVTVQRKLRSYSLATRSVAAVGLSILGTAVLAGLNFPIFLPFMQKGTVSPFWFGYSWDFLARLWIFASVSGIALAFSYLADVRDREERIAILQSLAHAAQLTALRNQLNPHFLFNALNSIAGLISTGEARQAESMTENLSDFLRLSLALDPQRLISLREELRLQELYLNIQQVRFPDRLNVSVEVPAELEDALVPSLITQPLIENSIKHAVAQSTKTVELRIAARAAGDRLELIVEDGGGNAPEAPVKGGRLGLANVSERLAAHFGAEAGVDSGRTEDGGFRNVILLPLHRA